MKWTSLYVWVEQILRLYLLRILRYFHRSFSTHIFATYIRMQSHIFVMLSLNLVLLCFFHAPPVRTICWRISIVWEAFFDIATKTPVFVRMFSISSEGFPQSLNFWSLILPLERWRWFLLVLKCCPSFCNKLVIPF